MHPQIQQDHPGRCPICGMDLVRGSDASHAGHGGVAVDAVLQQRLGVRLVAVERRELSREIRSWGTVTTNEAAGFEDRKSVVEGKSVSVGVDLGGRRIMKKKRQETAVVTE